MKKFTLFCTSLFLMLSLTASSSEPVEKSKSDSKVSENKEVVVDNAVVTDAMREFKSLTRVDRKMRIAQAKAALKEFKAQKAAAKAANMAEPSTNTVLLVILAILLPPLAVALHEHGINGKFWLSLLLTLLFFLPGVIYALLVVLGSA
ncbi:MAG: YqaE/Pmp3 family membrane protein [Chitinophagaceae bacterium]|nr:YqaE/Pmp3 family membrane protein [Chitinophagaceae bacterium]